MIFRARNDIFKYKLEEKGKKKLQFLNNILLNFISTML